MKWDRYPYLLVIAFLVSRAWIYAIGIRFDDYRHPFSGIPQLLPFELLRNDLWNSILYCHIQPPLYNLFLGIVNMNYTIVHITWMILAMTAATALYSILIGFGIGRGISCIVASIWMCSPSVMLLENTFIYDIPVVAIGIFTLWALQTGHLITFSWLCCALVLTRSTFHPFFFLAPALLIGWMAREKH